MNNESMAEKFWGYAAPADEAGCMNWTAGRSTKGYGRFRIDGRYRIASRVAWELARGPVPKGLCVCHHCDNPPCVNPAHLFLATSAENTADKVAKGRQMKGESVPWAVLSASDVLSAREFRTRGESYAEIADRFGVSVGCIHSALTGANWKSLGSVDHLPRRAKSRSSRAVAELLSDGREWRTSEVARAMGVRITTALSRLLVTSSVVRVSQGRWQSADAASLRVVGGAR